MDKYEFKLKVDEMKALVSARNYNAAAEIAETINWRKIRNLNALVLAGEVFEQVGRYEESKEILLMAYDKSPIGRNIIYRLAEIAVKTKRFDEAQEYYDEFVDIAPHDNLKFVLKYKMTAAQGLPYQEQIKILEELKEQEYSEEWAYELAYLYHKDMQPEKCVEACDELILWFGDGIYVEKALELKMHYQPLTKPQEEKYRMFRQKRTGVIEVKPNDFLESGEIVHEAVEIPSVQTNAGQYNTANLQEEIAKGMQQISTVKMQKSAMQQQSQQMQPAMQQQSQQTQQNPQEAVIQQNWQRPQKQPALQSWQQNVYAQPQNQYMEQQMQQYAYMEPQVQQNAYMEPQVQQNAYMESQVQQNPYAEPEMQRNPYMDQQAPFIRQSEQKSGWQEQPEPVMTMEEIQAEWEKTKQEMNDAARAAEGLEQEASKEKSFEKAEDLMQRLLAIVPQLAEKMEQQELTGQNSAMVQNDLEQAGRIVAGINQLLQEQIDSLTVEDEQQEPEQGSVVHRVSDPTREMPHLPENLLEGKEIGAIDKVEMNGSSLKKVSSGNDDNPVMSAWKDAPPGISALDLLQRVHMEKAAANDKEQMQAEFSAADTVQQMHAQQTIVDANPIQQTQAGHLDTEFTQQTQAGHPVAESIQQTRSGYSAAESTQQRQAGYSAIESLQRMRTKNLAADPVLQEQMQPQMQDAVSGSELQQMQEPVTNRVLYMQTSAANDMQNMQESIADSMQQAENETYMQRMLSADSANGVTQQKTAQTASSAMEQQRLDLEDAVKNIGIEAGYSEENMDIEAIYPEADTESEYPQESAPEYSLENNDNELRQEFPLENNEMGVRQEYPPESKDMGVRQEYPLENNRRNAQQEFENEQENLFLAARPRFLTQAKLQAESVMDGNKSTQITKEFSKEAMVAAHSTGFRENVLQTDSQNMEEMKILTPEQKQIFSYFVPIAGMEAQIYDLLIGVSEHLQYDKHAQSGNIIIEGISGSGKTVLIMDIIKVLQKEIKRPVGKTGKIDANALNQKDLDVLIDKISGGCLIIESAGRISRETAVKLSRCMENDHTGTLYILEDTEEGIQKALERDSSFAAKFTEKISIPLFSPDELVEFGKAYANDLNYDIDEMGVLALYKRIGAIQKLDHVTTLTEVKEIVDEAIDNAEKGVLKKVFGMLTATRANDDNYIILREKDFEDS